MNNIEAEVKIKDSEEFKELLDLLSEKTGENLYLIDLIRRITFFGVNCINIKHEINEVLKKGDK